MVMKSIWAAFVRLHTLAGPVIMLLYPLYASIKAIESPLKEDDQQWLTYWILYSFLTLFELAAEPLLEWVPGWYTIKLAFVCWLVLPQFKGATFVYEEFVRKYLRRNQPKLEAKLTDHQRRVLQMMSPEARSSCAQYIEDNGQEAFDKVIDAATREAAKNRPSPTKESQERY